MTETERELFKVLNDRSFKRGSFRLASGDLSPYYIDGKMTQVYAPGAYLLGEVIYERTKDRGIQAIGGLESGAIPLTTSAVAAYWINERRPMEGFWVRNNVKSHGTQKLIEGGLRPGMKVCIVDDVFTRGNSAMQAADEVRKFGCDVVLVLAIVDRLKGARKLFEGAGMPYESVFTIRDFGVESDEAPARQADKVAV